MRDISTPEIAVLVGELQQFAGFYIESFYELGEGRFRLKLNKKGEGQANLAVVLSHTINKTQYIEQAGEPTNFAIAVRRRIENTQIGGIEQLNNDRIVAINCHKGGSGFRIIFEMFGRGNLVITDESMNILLAYRNHEFVDRKIKPGEVYKTPKKSGVVFQVPGEPAPVVYRDDSGNIIDYSIVGNPRYKDLHEERFGAMQEMLDAVYGNAATAVKQSPELEKRSEELQKSIAKQEHILEQIDEQIAENKAAGAAIFNNLQLMNRIIKTAQSEKRITAEELQRLFPEAKIINVDLKDKTLAVELN